MKVLRTPEERFAGLPGLGYPPLLADAGLRAIAADLAGFGRSDKPSEPADHSFARHVEWIRALAFDHLGPRGLTMVGQDWGGLIGLRLVAEHADRFARVVASNTGLPTGDAPMPDVWLPLPARGRGRAARCGNRRVRPRPPGAIAVLGRTAPDGEELPMTANGGHWMMTWPLPAS